MIGIFFIGVSLSEIYSSTQVKGYQRLLFAGGGGMRSIECPECPGH